jgi:hypothetical protein
MAPSQIHLSLRDRTSLPTQNRTYCLAEDRVYELLQILPRVTGKRDVVEVERQ